MRLCNKCSTEKEPESFYNRKRGVSKTCKACEILDATKWKQTNKDKVSINDKKYKTNAKPKVIERSKCYKKEIRESFSDAHIRQLIYKKSLYLVNKQTLDENPEEYEFIRAHYLLKYNLNKNIGEMK